MGVVGLIPVLVVDRGVGTSLCGPCPTGRVNHLRVTSGRVES